VKGVLIAVGLGERTARPAWPGSRLLEPSLERPPVDQAIEAFSRAGFEEVAVVVGHSEDVLWRYLEDGARYGIAVYCLHNAQYPRGSATAIYAARAFVGGEPFVVSLSGYPVNASMLLRLESQSRGGHGVCVNRPARQRKEGRGAVKVRVDEQGRVGQIGRRLKHWHALSTGTFLFQPDVFGHITALLLRGDEDCSISTLLQRMIASGEAPYACDVSPLWDGVQGGDELLVWTAPMLSVRFAGAVGGVMGN
jgi:NDP-sugar pyrophosphorylase family protein